MNDRVKKIIKDITSYAIVIIVALLIKSYVFSPIKVNGTSMYPTLNHGDIMILNGNIGSDDVCCIIHSWIHLFVL